MKKEIPQTFNFEGFLYEIKKHPDGHYSVTVAENLSLTGSGQISAVGKQSHNMMTKCLSYATVSMLKKRKFTYSLNRQSIEAIFE